MPARIKMTSCQSSTDLIAMHGVDKDLLGRYRNISAVPPDQLEAFRADTAGAMVGEKIARRYGWKLGQGVTLPELDGISFNVRAILPARGSADDFLIYVSRRFLQEADDAQGISNFILVKPAPGVDPNLVIAAVDALPLTTQIQTQPEQAALNAVLDQMADLVRLSRLIIAMVIGVVLLAMGNAIAMSTRDRLREFGVLRTLGYARSALFALVAGEGALLGLIGAAAGGLGVFALSQTGLMQSVSSCSITIEFGIAPMDLALAGAAVVAAAVLGSVGPAWTAARINVVDALRPEE